MLKNREDYRPINFIIISSLLFYGLVRINLENIGIIQHFIYFLMGLTAAMIAWMVNHHHQHLAMFNENKYNMFFNNVLSILIGGSATYQGIIHQKEHENLETEHWTTNDQLSKTHGLYKMINYFFQSMHHEAIIQKEISTNNTIKIQIILERIVVTVVAALMAKTNLINFISFILPMWIFARFFYRVSHLLNQDACQNNQSVNRFRDFISGIENWMFCNAGYSTAHFQNPNKHWSKLPEIHRKSIVPRKNKELIVDSYLNYAYKYALNQTNNPKKEKSFSDLGRL